VNFAHLGKRRIGLEGSTPRPLDDLERKLAGAQGGHHQTPPLVGRVRLIVAPATEGHEVLEVEVRAALSRALRAHNEIDVAVENLQQGHELIDGLRVVRLIDEPIELGRRSPESADDLTLR